MATPQFIVNVEAAIYKENSWLMILRSMKEDHAGGTLSMVGGKIEHEDSLTNTLENGLIREIEEEVGVAVNPKMFYIESKMFVSQKGNHVIDIVFLCKYVSGEPEAKSEDEVDLVQWMTLKEIQEHKATPPWIIESMNKAEKLRIQL